MTESTAESRLYRASGPVCQHQGVHETRLRSYGGGQGNRRAFALYKCLLFVHRQAERCQKPTCQVSSFQTSACNQYHGDPRLKQRQLTLQCLLMNLSGKMRIFACKHDVHIIQIEIVEIPVVHVPVVNLSKKWL